MFCFKMTSFNKFPAPLKWLSAETVPTQGQRKSGQLCLVLVRPDRQTTDRVFLKIRTKSGQRTESRQEKSGQTDIGQHFPEKPDKNDTRTGHGQLCPPTSDKRSLLKHQFDNFSKRSRKMNIFNSPIHRLSSKS